MLTKQEFIKHIEKERPFQARQNNMLFHDKKIKFIFLCLYILGVILMLLFGEWPARNIQNNIDAILLTGDYLAFLFRIILIPLFPLCLLYIFSLDVSNDKISSGFMPVLYTDLGLKKVQKNRGGIEKLKRLGLFPGHYIRMQHSFETRHILIQEIEASYARTVSFWGPIITFKVNYPYPTTLVLDKENTPILTQFKTYLRHIKWKTVKLEHKNFMEIYQIVGLDPAKSQALFTPVLIEKFQKLHDIYQAPINALFINNQVVLAIDMNRDMLELDDMPQTETVKALEQFYDEITVLWDFQSALSVKQEKK